jgi:hypothetical protein
MRSFLQPHRLHLSLERGCDTIRVATSSSSSSPVKNEIAAPRKPPTATGCDLAFLRVNAKFSSLTSRIRSNLTSKKVKGQTFSFPSWKHQTSCSRCRFRQSGKNLCNSWWPPILDIELPKELAFFHRPWFCFQVGLEIHRLHLRGDMPDFSQTEERADTERPTGLQQPIRQPSADQPVVQSGT